MRLGDEGKGLPCARPSDSQLAFVPPHLLDCPCLSPPAPPVDAGAWRALTQPRVCVCVLLPPALTRDPMHSSCDLHRTKEPSRAALLCSHNPRVPATWEPRTCPHLCVSVLDDGEADPTQRAPCPRNPPRLCDTSHRLLSPPCLTFEFLKATCSLESRVRLTELSRSSYKEFLRAPRQPAPSRVSVVVRHS